MSQMQPLAAYSTLIFDCDGVVLDSNKIKTEAFYQSALPYGEAAARAMYDYHISAGGVSRYKKFSYFLEKIVPLYGKEIPCLNLNSLLQKYADYVFERLLSCQVASGLEMLRQKTSHARWLIVSGGDQNELRRVFTQRGIAGWFDGGIFGSPCTKDEILTRELASSNIKQPALFLGDSKYDYQAACDAKLDFLFLSDWTEVGDWRNWTVGNGITVKKSIKHLVECD